MMMENWSTLLVSLVAGMVFMAIAAALVWMGYWMGRNSSDLPVRSDNNPKEINQGPGDDPGGDPFEEAMRLPENDSEDNRIDTMRPR